MYIGIARTRLEALSGLLLAENVLPGHLILRDNSIRLNSNSHRIEEFKLDHIIVAVSTSGEVCGVVRLLSRYLQLACETYTAAGISSVSIATSWRNQGLGRRLIQKSMEQAKILGYELTVLFARRAVDYFYPKFDIWGIASYSTLKVEEFPQGLAPDSSFKLRPFTLSDLDAISSCYLLSYNGCSGVFLRDIQHWTYLVNVAKHRAYTIFVAESGHHIVGYAVIHLERVIEFAFYEPQHALPFLYSLFMRFGKLPLVLPSNHSLLYQISHFDFSLLMRRCMYGGHMVGVLNIERACERLSKRVEHRSTQLNLPSQTEDIDGVALSWDRNRSSVMIDIKYDSCLLGPLATARLLGVKLVGNHVISQLAPVEPLDFLLWDEF